MRTHHLEAILLFLENAFVEGETRIPIGEDSYMPYALIREARGEIERIDLMIGWQDRKIREQDDELFKMEPEVKFFGRAKCKEKTQ